MTFGKYVTVMPPRVVGRNPDRAGTRADFPVTRLPAVSVAVPPVIPGDPNVIVAGGRSPALLDGNRRSQFDDQFRRVRRTDSKGDSAESRY